MNIIRVHVVNLPVCRNLFNEDSGQSIFVNLFVWSVNQKRHVYL